MDASPTNTRENQLLAHRAQTDWAGLTIGIVTYAALLVARFNMLTRDGAHTNTGGGLTEPA